MVNALSEHREIRLPKPQNITMRRFSLFRNASSPSLAMDRGVFCLAGANGLGKSTFLAALGYGITGVVPEPGREFRSAEDYYKKCRPYAASFFKGRIDDEDIEAAEVDVEFSVDQYRYRLIRGLFEPDDVRFLQVIDTTTGELLVDDGGVGVVDRHKSYVESLVDHCGLDSMAQLVFLQTFVLTFDERRDLLFWNDRALSNAMFLAFGVSPETARHADKLQEDIRKADSLARNYSWQAADVRRQLEKLVEAAGDVEDDRDDDPDEATAANTHRQLSNEYTEALAAAEASQEELSEAHLSVERRSSDLRALRSTYTDLWAERVHGRGHPSTHPVVTTTLSESRCSICGSESEAVVQRIEASLTACECPLCGSATDTPEAGADLNGDGGSVLEQLERLDAQIAEAQNGLMSAEREVQRLTARRRDANARAAALRGRLDEFERLNEEALLRRQPGNGGLGAVTGVYQAQIDERMTRVEQYRAVRDDAKKKLRPLQKDLSNRYALAESTFVPRFERLATSFLGLDLDVEPVMKPDRMLLRLSVAGQRRRDEVALSESQRFFVDIALRMALIAQISGDQAVKPALLIDTPEGSLDIAYEAKAGTMFSLFAKDGYSIVMTANINTSKLLQRLAEECGRRLMHLERMTSWTNLSDVQADEEVLFDEAYAEILAALDCAAS